MVLPVDEVHAVLRELVLAVLGAQDIGERVLLPPDVELGELDVVGVQNGHAPQVHQGSDIEYLHGEAAAEGGVGVEIAQIADGVDGRADGQGGQELTPGDLHLPRTLPAAALQRVHQPENQGIGPRQEQNTDGQTGPAGAVGGVVVELPLQGGGQLGQDKGPHAVVPRVGGGEVAAQVDEDEHQRGGEKNAGHEPGHRHVSGGRQKDAHHRQEEGLDGPQLPALQPVGEQVDAEHAGDPVGQGGIEAGNVAQRHLLTSPRKSLRASRNAFFRARLTWTSSPWTTAQSSRRPSTCSRFTR